MYHSPRERKKSNGLALKIKKIETPLGLAFYVYKSREHYVSRHVDQLIVASVNYAEHKSCNLPVGGDYCLFAEHNPCCRPGKTRENDTGYQGICQQAVVRLN